jgi:mannose-6-phosphate isomerase-like protein (cupin superfamily)
MIVGGEGICRTPEQTATLSAGTIFVIPAETKHSFHTTNSVLRVVAWHPDSDTGPRHDDHPMVNRTIINGISASQIPEIHT